MEQKLFRRRVIMTVFGVCLCGFSVGIFSFSNLGMDPFQVLAHGLWNLTNLSFGTFYVILNAIMLVSVFVLDRSKIGLGTLINLFLLGYIADFSLGLWSRLFPEPTTVVRVLSLIFAIVVICLSSALYMTSNLGVSTYDAVALIITEKYPRLPFRLVRIATDLLCVIIGVLFGGVAGIATIITAFFMGPLISWFNKTVAIPLLNK